MPEWTAIVKQRLGALGLDPRREAEIVEELAGYCQELSEEGRDRGLPMDAAHARALDEVRDWDELRREIQKAELEEEPMNHRTRRIWIPGLLTLTLSMGLFGSLESLGLHMRILWLNRTALIFSLPWMLVLPFVGALGAYISERAGGGHRERLLASLFPSGALSILFFSVFAVGWIVESWVAHTLAFAGFVNLELSWAIIPGAALLIGALPFLVPRKPRPVPAS